MRPPSILRAICRFARLLPLAALVLLPAALLVAVPHVGARAQEVVRIGGTGTLQGTMRGLADAYRTRHPQVAFDLPRSLGSAGGISAVLAGALDLATASRALNRTERQAGAITIPLGETPFVFVTSHPDLHASVGADDVRALFTRQRTTWPDGQPIRLVLRPEEDSDSAFLLQQFPDIATGLAAVRRQQTIPIALTDQDNLDQAETLPGSFAATSLATVLSERRRVFVLPFDGVDPTLENLVAGRYRLGRTLFLVRRSDASAATLAFLGFVASPAGEALLRDCGVLPAAPP